jgi:hypothetical protein
MCEECEKEGDPLWCLEAISEIMKSILKKE